jgi:hypothetical protein
LNQKIENNFNFPQAARCDFGPKAPSCPACFYFFLFVSFLKLVCQVRAAHSAPSSPSSRHDRSCCCQAGRGAPCPACHPELLTFRPTASPTEPHRCRPLSPPKLMSFPFPDASSAPVPQPLMAPLPLSGCPSSVLPGPYKSYSEDPRTMPPFSRSSSPTAGLSSAPPLSSSGEAPSAAMAWVHGGPRAPPVHELVDTVHSFLLSEIVQNPIIPVVFHRGP